MIAGALAACSGKSFAPGTARAGLPAGQRGEGRPPNRTRYEGLRGMQQLSTQAIQRMNAAVDVDHRAPAAVARRFLATTLLR